ncbi:MAG: hypothetical protein RMK91_05610 [Pseudanabaenaceae cyanobacterium SKYGB_i_bin29]|nr:hypothetical protein [Pseudanabaenaceae cyanobacterium SKYG29]MDW8421326.1 hypothetical protein [Pseudanabaenaceae cyanobacterium SKYGB_i_bin29]
MLDPIPERRSASSADALSVLKGSKPKYFLLKSPPPQLPGETLIVDRTRNKFYVDFRTSLERNFLFPSLSYRKLIAVPMIFTLFIWLVLAYFFIEES